MPKRPVMWEKRILKAKLSRPVTEEEWDKLVVYLDRAVHDVLEDIDYYLL